MATLLPGIIRRHPNDNLTTLKSAPWSDILPLLGADAEIIFSSLLLDCGIFTRIESGKDNYFQLSGIPILELPQLPKQTISKKSQDQQRLSPGAIRFVRHRILYARPSLNTAGKVKFGLHHTHILQRVSDIAEQRQAIHLLKYIYPRQFGLHNVFTSKVDRDETTQPFKDYTFREQEITGQKKHSLTWAPRRLRAKALRLVQKIHQNHRSCSYSQLLRHYCPLVSTKCEPSVFRHKEITSSTPSSEPFVTQVFSPRTLTAEEIKNPALQYGGSSFLPHSTPMDRVSAFCRAVISHLLPRDAFGSGLEGQHNRDKVMEKIDAFVRLRRFENLSLHQVSQGLRIGSISWLSLQGDSNKSMSKTDHSKRLEILHEFLYYIFDSLLTPVIRAHFYVTESSTHRHRLFYFRQDVWRKLSEPSLATLKLSMYAPIRPGEARHKLQSQSLGYSQLRLLPKDQGARPITNLKRKQLKVGPGRRVLGASINTQLAPLFSVLNFERMRDAAPLGSALLSVGDIHGKVAGFKKAIPSGSRLFFAKVDINSCFDSIPQEHILEMVEQLFTQSSYRTTRHVEFKTLDIAQRTASEGLRRKFTGIARPADHCAVLSETSVSGIASRKRHVIFSDLGQQRVWTRTSLLHLLQDHVGDSVVKVGKRFMKQVDGIPQGSVLSSLLCSYFYGAFERNELSFLHPQSCLLLRLIDDFLLVTTDDKPARRFLGVMANGHKRYGIQVNPEKSLVNFDVAINGHKLPRIHGGTFFPYCGMWIDMSTLEMNKDRERKDIFISNTLTVENCSRPGTTLRRKTLSSLKIQMHSMLLDMSLNSRDKVVSTLAGNFIESAMKMHQYLAGLAAKTRPSQELIRSMIEELITAATKICRAKNGSNGQIKHITRAQMCWIASAAFERVLRSKQSQYKPLLVWLSSLRESTQSRMNMRPPALERLLQDNKKAFRAYVY